jgi:hypothetical protein
MDEVERCLLRQVVADAAGECPVQVLAGPAADGIRADAVRFRQLVTSDAATGRTAALFA